MTLDDVKKVLQVTEEAKFRRPDWRKGLFLEESDGPGKGWFRVDVEADVYERIDAEDLRADDYLPTRWPMKTFEAVLLAA